jgi:hypothetical protein
VVARAGRPGVRATRAGALSSQLFVRCVGGCNRYSAPAPRSRSAFVRAGRRWCRAQRPCRTRLTDAGALPATSNSVLVPPCPLHGARSARSQHRPERVGAPCVPRGGRPGVGRARAAALSSQHTWQLLVPPCPLHGARSARSQHHPERAGAPCVHCAPVCELLVPAPHRCQPSSVTAAYTAATAAARSLRARKWPSAGLGSRWLAPPARASVP